MACVYKRQNADGTDTWRLVVRYKGLPTLCLSFALEADCYDWIEKHEMAFIKNPRPYLKKAAKDREYNKRARRWSAKLDRLLLQTYSPPIPE